jgi:glycosyltransferase involved in cell wall biosynthesis
MNILFLTIIGVNDITGRGIYNDLMRYFRDNDHQVHIVCPTERRFHQKTHLKVEQGISILKVKTLNIQKTNIIEKGIGTLLVEQQFLNAIKIHFNAIKFDLVLYSTPPITFTKVIKYIKVKDHAKSYLLLKDIFPQNAVDLKMMKENGILHNYFKKKERELYAISDHVGCMSPANVAYILKKHYLNPDKVEVNPNSLDPVTNGKPIDKSLVRNKYKIPTNAVVYVYGGNLGKPQGIDFIIKVLNSNINRKNMFFVIVGSGTQYNKLAIWFKNEQPNNMLLLNALQKSEYDLLLAACDVGLIFLDHRFTIPNFPSRLLSYIEFKIPVLAATDKVTDLGVILSQNNFGKWSLAGDLDAFNRNLEVFLNADIRNEMGANAYRFMMENYQVKHSYNLIINKFNNL